MSGNRISEIDQAPTIAKHFAHSHQDIVALNFLFCISFHGHFLTFQTMEVISGRPDARTCIRVKEGIKVIVHVLVGGERVKATRSKSQ